MLKRYQFIIFNLIFLSVFGIIFVIGYTRPLPDIEASPDHNSTGVYRSDSGGCAFCP